MTPPQLLLPGHESIIPPIPKFHRPRQKPGPRARPPLPRPGGCRDRPSCIQFRRAFGVWHRQFTSNVGRDDPLLLGGRGAVGTDTSKYLRRKTIDRL